jgi:ABC-2 type transport system permease protein
MIDSLLSPRLLAIIVKEFWAALRDPRSRLLLFLPPLMQLVLFSTAATLEIKKVTLGVLDMDGGAASREFTNQLAGSPNVKRLVWLTSNEHLANAIDNQSVLGVLVFDASFSRDVAAGRSATVQFVLDGRRSNAAQIVSSYISQIAANTGAALRPAVRSDNGVRITNWFNPNLDYQWFIMPALVVQISALSALSVTSQSVARERELGTFDQLMVSPLQNWEIVLGKLVPPFVIGLFNGTVFLAIVPLVFGVPYTGSIGLFFLATAAGLFSILGIGMLLSTIARTQQQAFLGMFSIVPPMILLSGFASPIDNMPGWLQVIAMANPLTHFNVIMEGLFLKAMPFSDMMASIWPLLLSGVVTLALAIQQFRARME